MFLPEEICDADYGVNIYEEDPELSKFDDPNIPITTEFVVGCWADTTWAPGLEHARSGVMVITRVSGAAVFWAVVRISGIADSSTRAKYCGASAGFRRLLGVVQICISLVLLWLRLNSILTQPRQGSWLKIRRSQERPGILE